MNKKQVERYFQTLSKIYPKKCRIILTGAAAGALYGRVRATMDIDFCAEAADWENFSRAVEETGVRTGIAAQYAEDIDRWSSITLMDYKKRTFIYKRFGSVEVRLMEPSYWAIGKLSRYLDPDIQDLVKVFRETGTPWREAAAVAGLALRQSPKSTACFLFRRQTEDFFRRFGKKTWRKVFDAKEAIALFRKRAGVKKERSGSSRTRKWLVYIAKCADGSLYTGVALDIERRMREHASGKGSRYVRSHLPVQRVYQEAHADKSQALKREAQIKRWTREKKLALICGD